MKPPPRTEAERIAGTLTKAQQEIMLGHLVEITPDEGQQLEDWGLKGAVTFEWVRVRKLIWPITKKGLAVREVLLSQEQTDEQ